MQLLNLKYFVLLLACSACKNTKVQKDSVHNFVNTSVAIPAGENTIHIKDFGAKPDGVTNNTIAFQKASKYLQANGGMLIIDSGTYIVGKQRFSGTFEAGSSYFAEPIIDIKNAAAPIIIRGYKATLKAADGLKYGSFNPVTGKKDSIRAKSNQTDYYAAAFGFINIENCASVSIEGLTLDGNSGKLDMGPAFNKNGNQLMATGIRATNNKQVNIQDAYIHHCALDAIIIAWDGLTDKHPIYPHTISNVKAVFNGRQGISWVGGNYLMVTNSEFSSTGKALNKGKPVIGAPTAGIDIEIENSIIKNGYFINCIVNDNTGPGLSSIGHDTYNINFKKVTFIGTTNLAALPRTQNLRFDSCTFVGRVAGILGSADKQKANYYTNCLFTMDTTKSPSGKVFGNNSAFWEAENVVFNNCVFDAANRELPVFSNKEIEFIDCEFYQKSDKNFSASAIFKGTTRIVINGKANIITAETKLQGALIYNGQRVKDVRNIKQ